MSRASRSSSRRFDNPRRVRNDVGQIQDQHAHFESDPLATESTPLFSTADDVSILKQGAEFQSIPIQDQISSFIVAPSSDEVDQRATAAPFNLDGDEPAEAVQAVAQAESFVGSDPVPEPFIVAEPAPETLAEADPVAEPIFGVAPQSFPEIQGIPVAAPEQVESTQGLEDPNVDFRIVSQQPFPTILVNPPPQQVPVEEAAVQPIQVPIAALPEIVAEPLPLEPVDLSQTSTEAAVDHSAVNLKEPATLVAPPQDAPIPVKLELSPPSGYQSLTHHTDKPSLYKVLPPFFGILYPIPAPHSSYSVGPQVPYNQPKQQHPAPTYGPPRATHPTPQQQGNENYPRRQFGFPPTPRALGFPPVSNTRDNLHRDVNWGRLGRPYRSA